MDLLTWFQALSAAKIRRMMGEAETQVLDCKQIGGEGDLKKNLATILSGFANSQGGVCIWGVDARKVEGVDCISAFPGLSDARGTASRLDELTPHAVAPGVQGVVHRALETRGLKSGFVATYVPPSDSGPHMARFGEDRYYQRIGQSFLRMEPFQIADMFGRRARPQLEVTAEMNNTFEYRVRVSNIGRGAAQAPFLQLSVNSPFTRNVYGVDGNRNEVLPFQTREVDGSWLHAGDSTFLLHPTMSLLVGGVWLGLQPMDFLGKGLVPPELQISFKVGALEVMPTSGVLRIALPA